MLGPAIIAQAQSSLYPDRQELLENDFVYVHGSINQNISIHVDPWSTPMAAQAQGFSRKGQLCTPYGAQDGQDATCHMQPLLGEPPNGNGEVGPRVDRHNKIVDAQEHPDSL